MNPEHEKALAEYREKRDAALKADREWRGKKEAERKARGIPEQPAVPFVPDPAQPFEPLKEVEINPRPLKPFIKYIRTLQDAPEGDKQDFVVRQYSRLHDKIEADAEETGSREYVVLNEGEQYCVWRLPRE